MEFRLLCLYILTQISCLWRLFGLQHLIIHMDTNNIIILNMVMYYICFEGNIINYLV